MNEKIIFSAKKLSIFKKKKEIGAVILIRKTSSNRFLSEEALEHILTNLELNRPNFVVIHEIQKSVHLVRHTVTSVFFLHSAI